MKIVFCTTCKGRSQHIKLTLPKNLEDNKDYPDAKFLILNYNSPDDLMDYLYLNHLDDVISGRLVVYSTHEPEKFKMAHAKNMAHHLGILEGADVLVNLDADNLTNPGFASYIAAQFQQNGMNSFLWAKMIPGVLPRGISGRIVVPKDAFLKVGGYDERFEIYSRDDKDFNERLRRLGVSAFEIDTQYLNGVRHNDKLRYKEYPHAQYAVENYDELISEKSDKTIVNYGRIGLGRVFKNFDWEYTGQVIELGPVPTRIFGIGMHKTATTSLHTALTILGFDSAHWKTAHWAKKIWNEMQLDGRSLTLEKHYALSDLPITLLYKELDKTYPGSKFILTVRDEQEWLNSVRNHWNPELNPYRHQWNTDPFTHKIHKVLYGQKGFDAELFLERYRRHNAEVLEYFKDRPDDLLVMDINKDGWWALCRFLGKPVPSMDYPMLNKAGNSIIE